MPIYEYRCQNCGHLTAVLQKFNDNITPICEKCESTNLTKIISHNSFILKGGGWYSDGYCSKKPAASSSQNTCPLNSDKSTSSSSAQKASDACQKCCTQT